jgi:hypothetical protein
MCDFLNDKLVTCFYSIGYNRAVYQFDAHQSGVVYINEKYDSYETGDTLPIQTNYYKYPDNFYIYDYRDLDETKIVHIIEDGIYRGFQGINEVEIDYNTAYIMDNTGRNILDIKSKNDFAEISRHWQEKCKEKEVIMSKYFPKGIADMFVTNTDEYHKRKPLCDEEVEKMLEDFKGIWFKEDENRVAKKYAILLEAIKVAFWETKEDYSEGDESLSEMLSHAVAELETFTHFNPDAREKYLKLFDYVPEFYIDNILSMANQAI